MIKTPCLGNTEIKCVFIITPDSVALAVLSPPAHTIEAMVTQTQSSLLLQAISHFNKCHNTN